MTLRVVVLISGSGTNLQAIIDSAPAGGYEVAAVISNRPDVYGLERAKQAGIPHEVLPHRGFAGREAFDVALQSRIDAYQPGLVTLAGFMRILTPAFVAHYQGRLMNIHPSLLPAFRGLHTHQRVLEAGNREHGATVHFVIPDLDAGPIIIQAKVPVLAEDTPDTLAARVLTREHVIYPQAIRWFAEGRLALQDGQVYLDGMPRRDPLAPASPSCVN